MSLPIVIIGTGLAGYNLAKELRKVDKATPLIMLTADDGRNYSKPMLSTGFTKKKQADELAMATAEQMAEQLDAEILTHTWVESLEPDNKSLRYRRSDGNEEAISYEKLVLAWGAEVFQPPIEGDGLERVFSVNDLMDYHRFRKALVDRKRVVIMGAGLIGCEFANDLANGGYEVSVVDMADRVLPALLPPPASQSVQAGLQSLAVQLYLNNSVTRVDKQGTGVEVTLSNGEKLSADLVVSAIGLRPRTALAEQAGIQVNKGIVVDNLLRTSAEDIYALGDCAEVNGFVLLYVLPLMACARALAKTLSGNNTPVAYPAMPVTIKTPVCPVVVAPPPASVEGEWEIEQDGTTTRACYRDKQNQLQGFALTGEAVKENVKLAKELPAYF